MSKPLHEPTFLILTALVGGPLHGYAVLAEVESISGGRVRLRVGTLYAALDRLTEEGLVAVESEEVVNGRLRRTYRVTGAGSETLAAEVDRMTDLAKKARARLRGRQSAGVSTLATAGAR
ncbi:MAG TPA: PadR family transcriptional regulator [Nocardioidaceae bacterium]